MELKSVLDEIMVGRYKSCLDGAEYLLAVAFYGPALQLRHCSFEMPAVLFPKRDVVFCRKGTWLCGRLWLACCFFAFLPACPEEKG